MSTATKEQAATEPRPDNAAAIVKQQSNAPAVGAPRLPYHPLIQERFGVDKASWKALVEAIFPNATCVESVILALSYCRARKLDPFKRNVHIVPIYDKNRGCMTDTIWPGIGELRTTAFRTGEYAGRDETTFGPDIKMKFGGGNNATEVTFPEWAQATVFRMVQGQRVSFAGPRVYWLETYATIKRDSDVPNDMWGTRPRGQIDKCAEAAALRAAFPEEIGSEYIPEEIHGQREPARKVIEVAPGASKSEQLADKLGGGEQATQGDESTIPADEGSNEPQTDPLEGIETALADCPDQASVMALRQGAAEGLDSENHARLNALCDKRREQLAAAATKKSGKLV